MSSETEEGATPACRFFQSPQGCFRGDSCSFRHEKKARQADGASSKPADNVVLSASNPYANGAMTSSTPPPGARPCRFYSAGSGCRNGSACPFAHVGPPGGVSATASGLEDPPLPQEMDYGAQSGAMGVPSGGAVFYNHPGLPPPMMMVMPEQQMHGDGSLDGASGTGNSHTEAATTGSSTPRRRLKIQANPQKKETISEILPVLTRDIEGPFIAIDVECVATGSGTNDRDVARIAVVDEDEQVIFDQYVKPTKPIMSYLTQLTGITESNLVGAPTLDEALVQLKATLPRDCVIVGQSIKKDLEWLTLQKPGDYRTEFDVADLFRLPMQSHKGGVRYRYFSLRHVAKYLLGHDIQEADHDPVIDARYAMKVFKQFRYLHESPGHRDAVLQTLLKTPRTPSFADRYPVIDGVSMRAPRKPGTSPSIRTANRIAAAHAQHASAGAATAASAGHGLRHQQSGQQQQQLYL